MPDEYGERTDRAHQDPRLAAAMAVILVATVIAFEVFNLHLGGGVEGGTAAQCEQMAAAQKAAVRQFVEPLVLVFVAVVGIGTAAYHVHRQTDGL